jgi:predicted NUDIX family NTP pyrophosphohydrolase
MRKLYQKNKRWSTYLLLLFSAFMFSFVASAQSIDKLEQLANGALKNAIGPEGICIGDDWVTGNVNAAKAHYTCGMTIPYRMAVSGLVPGNTYQVTIGYDTKKSDKHAIDFLTSFDRPTNHEIFGHSAVPIDPLIGLLLASTPFNDYPLPAPTANMVTPTGMTGPIDGFNQSMSDGWGNFRIYNGYTIGDGLVYIGTDPSLITTSDYLVVNFTVNPGQTKVVLAWGGNIACADLWGEGMSAEAISGSPYHMFVHNCVNLSGCGNKEVQLAASAIYVPTAPLCTAYGDQLDCYGASDGEIRVEWEDGTAPFDIYLDGSLVASNVAASPYTITGLKAGLYTVMIVDDENLDTECFADIIEPPLVPIDLKCGENTTVGPCISEQAVSAAFESWLAGFTVSGGTEPVTVTYKVNDVVVNLVDLVPPDECGGSITIVAHASDFCEVTADCSGTFTVTPAAEVKLTVPENHEAQKCESQADINTAFSAWLLKAGFEGGCNGHLSMVPAEPKAPDHCGGMIQVTWTVTSDCEIDVVKSATFTVPYADKVELTVPDNHLAQKCESQADISTAFSAWLLKAGFEGGCNGHLSMVPAEPKAPDHCGGMIQVTWTVTSDCEIDVVKSATFTVPYADKVELTVPDNHLAQKCESQADISTAFSAWLLKAGFEGGCNGHLSMVPAEPKAPDHCGGMIQVTWTVTSDCEIDVVKSATFTVPYADKVELTVPDNHLAQKCESQADISTAFSAWLLKAGFEGGCNGHLSMVPAEPKAPDHCGGMIQVTWTVTSDCEIDVVKSATFTVPYADKVELTVPDNHLAQKCESQADISTAFSAWLLKAGFEGGCNGHLSMVPAEPKAPDHCGGMIQVTWTVTSDCEIDVVKSATFTVPYADKVELTVPDNHLAQKCESQADISTAFSAWLLKAGFEGGCNGHLSMVPAEPKAPDHCGGMIQVTWTVTSDCEIDVVKSATFTVPYADKVELTVPDNHLAQKCESQADISTAFSAWLLKAGFEGGCNGHLSMVPAEPKAPDHCGGMIEVTWTVTSDCEEDVVKSATFTVPEPDPIQVSCPEPVALPECTLPDDIQTAYDNWRAGFTKSGDCNLTDNLADLPEDVVINLDGSVTLIEFTYIVTGDCDSDECSSSFEALPCLRDVICTYTQGYFGNYKGTSCDGETGGYSTVELIEHSVSNWGGVLVIGKPGRSVRISTGKASCVVDRLPGGNGIGILPEGDICLCNYNLLTKQGKISNKLLAQTLVLGLNLGIGTPLGAVELDQGWIVTAAPDGGCGSDIPLLQECIYNLEGYLTDVINPYWYCKIDQSVIDMIHALMLPANVDGLFELANQALGGWGTYSDAQLTAIANAADKINNLFDGCRVFMGIWKTNRFALKLRLTAGICHRCWAPAA